MTDAKLDAVEALIAWGEEQGVSLLDVAIGGLAAQPGCSSVIAGATTPPSRSKANAAAGRLGAVAGAAHGHQRASCPRKTINF